VHGIDRAALPQQGRPAREVAQRLNHDLRGRTACCDGWVHDHTWLARLFDAAGCVPRFHLESVNRLLDDERPARLDRLRHDAFNELGIARHHASNDARALQWALERPGA
jgi:hypothetical protein